MKALAVGLAVVALAVVGVVTLVSLNLRALVGAHRDQLVARVERVVGRPITVGDVEPSWWPLGIRLRRITVDEDPSFGTGPFLVADGIVLSVRPWPLVHGRIEAAGVVLDRPEITLRRGARGDWNVTSLGETPGDGANGGAAKRKEHRRGFRVPLEWALGVVLSQVRDGTIIVEDRRGGEGARVVLRHVHLHADDVRLGALARLRLEASVFAPDDADLLLDVRVPNLGAQDVEHSPFTGRLELTNVDLATVGGWLRPPRAASGRVGRLTLDAAGTLAALQSSVELRAEDPELRIGDVALGGLRPLVLRAKVARTGTSLTVAGLEATLGTLAIHGEGEAQEDPWRVALSLHSEPDGVASLPIGGTIVDVSALDGHLSLDREGAALAPLRLTVAGTALETRGWITGVAPLAFDVHVESRPFGGTVAADVMLERSGAARARVEAGAVDLAAALARFVPELEGRVEGRASGAMVVTARVADGALAAGSLAGDGSVTVVDGRLRNVNLPDLVVDQIERIPLMPELVSTATRARYAELFGSRDTVVQSATLPFTLARGRLTSERAVFDNPAYQVTGGGWIDEAQQVRFRGTVLLGATVSRTLREDVRAAKYLAADDGRITLPFVARGRLGKVSVEPDGKRLRERGLTALLGGSPKGGDNDHDHDDHDADDHDRNDPRRRRDEPIEDRVIERLERMLHP